MADDPGDHTHDPECGEGLPVTRDREDDHRAHDAQSEDKQRPARIREDHTRGEHDGRKTEPEKTRAPEAQRARCGQWIRACHEGARDVWILEQSFAAQVVVCEHAQEWNVDVARRCAQANGDRGDDPGKRHRGLDRPNASRVVPQRGGEGQRDDREIHRDLEEPRLPVFDRGDDGGDQKGQQEKWLGPGEVEPGCPECPNREREQDPGAEENVGRGQIPLPEQ